MQEQQHGRECDGCLLQEYLDSAVGFLERSTALQLETADLVVSKERVQLLLEKSRWWAIAGNWDLAWALAQRAVDENKLDPGIDGAWLLEAEAWEKVSHLMVLRGQQLPSEEGGALLQELEALRLEVNEQLATLEEHLPEEEFAPLRLRIAPRIAWIRALCDGEVETGESVVEVQRLDEILMRF